MKYILRIIPITDYNFTSKICIAVETKLLNVSIIALNFPYHNNTNTVIIMTSSNRNIFHVTGPLWGDSTGHRWIPLTKSSDAELWFFLAAPQQRVEQTIQTHVIWDTIAFIMPPLQRWTANIAQLRSGLTHNCLTLKVHLLRCKLIIRVITVRWI